MNMTVVHSLYVSMSTIILWKLSLSFFDWLPLLQYHYNIIVTAVRIIFTNTIIIEENNRSCCCNLRHYTFIYNIISLLLLYTTNQEQNKQMNLVYNLIISLWVVIRTILLNKGITSTIINMMEMMTTVHKTTKSTNINE